MYAIKHANTLNFILSRNVGVIAGGS